MWYTVYFSNDCRFNALYENCRSLFFESKIKKLKCSFFPFPLHKRLRKFVNVFNYEQRWGLWILT